MRRIAWMMLLVLAWSAPSPAQNQPKSGARELIGDASTAPRMRVYVGTYTGPKSKGIYLLEFDPTTGALTPKGVAAETPSPSFLAVHPNKKFLYAANEVNNFGGRQTGSVSAFAIDPATGALTPLNSQPSGGADPCAIIVDPTGKNLLVANYGGGSLEVVPIAPDGKLGEPSAVVQHKGSSVNRSRQTAPHAHSIDLDASGKLAIASDLGLDKVMVYRFDPEKGTLEPNATPHASVAPGAGPRHFAFHPDGRHAYVINEIASTVTAFEFDPSRGSFAELHTLSTRAPGGKSGNSTAEILAHPSGKFVYGSNRGDDSLAIYSVDPASGKLSLVGHQSTGGRTPRNFGIDPTGQFLLAANQNSDTVVVFRIDNATGQLKQVGEPVPVPSPVCVKFVPIGG
jgi:6-phosphogluconolactonase